MQQDGSPGGVAVLLLGEGECLCGQGLSIPKFRSDVIMWSNESNQALFCLLTGTLSLVAVVVDLNPGSPLVWGRLCW